MRRKKIGDPDLKVGDELEIVPGLNVRVISDEKTQEFVEEGSMSFAVITKELLPKPYTPSVSVRCGVCEADCWMSCSVDAIRGDTNAPIICINCLRKEGDDTATGTVSG